MKKQALTEAVVLTLALLLPLTVSAGPASSGKVFVVNSNDAGPGSFRDAIDQANADATITRIQFLGGVRIIALQETVEFTGTQDLSIEGNGAELNGGDIAVGPAFLTTGGGDLAISRLTVGDAPAEGISVLVPSDATGIIRVSLFKVDIIKNAGHGVLVNDQQDPTTQDGVQPDPDGSAAAVDVSIANSRFIQNGYSVSDRDGLRVNEGGEGDLTITIKHTLAQDNAADGIEVDERGTGDVRVDAFGLQVVGNGPFDSSDLDDGFDIDEYNDGSVFGTISQTAANDNFEEGFDFNENNAGDLRVDMQQVEANGNGEEGIDYEEDDDFPGGGDLVTTMVGITANGNGINDDGDAGLKIREKDVGNLDVTVKQVEASNNLIGGISIREDDQGSLVSSLTKASSRANSGRGIDFDENADGDLTAAVTKSTALTNGDVDLRADEASTGVGTLLLSKVSFGTSGGNVTPTIAP
jgi:hypothetical protein